MADDADYLRTKFTVAVHLDEEQKRQIEIRRLRDDAERKRLQGPSDLRYEMPGGERIAAHERERQGGRDFDFEL